MYIFGLHLTDEKNNNIYMKSVLFQYTTDYCSFMWGFNFS